MKKQQNKKDKVEWWEYLYQIMMTILIITLIIVLWEAFKYNFL